MRLQTSMLGVPAVLGLMAAILLPAPELARRWTPASAPEVPVQTLAAGSVVHIGWSGRAVPLAPAEIPEHLFTGDDERPFLAALASLPEGGEIVVAPGTYSFRQPVSITADDVRIHGEGATLLSSALWGVGLFDVTGESVVLEGLELVDHLPVTGHSLVRVRSQGFQLQGCTFRGRDAQGALPTFVELGSHTLLKHTSAWIHENEFHPHRGWTVLRADGLEQLHITQNTVMGQAIGERQERGFLAYGMRLEDVALARISGNVFLELGDLRDPVRTAIEATGGEAGHWLSIEDNVFHSLAAERALHLAGERQQSVKRNAFGSFEGAQTVAMVDVEAPIQAGAWRHTSVASGSLLSGNVFHATAGGPALRINGGSGHVVVDNEFADVSLVSLLAGDRTVTEGVSILSNRFRHDGDERHDYPAILVLGGAQHVIHGNSLRNYPADGIVVEPSSGEVHLNGNEQR